MALASPHLSARAGGGIMKQQRARPGSLLGSSRMAALAPSPSPALLLRPGHLQLQPPQHSRQHHLHGGSSSSSSSSSSMHASPLVARAYNFSRGPDAGDRVIAALPYLLPLLDALPYGRYVFLDYPFVARAMAPLGPLAVLYNSVPFAPFLLFLGVYSLIVNNASLSRFVRVNAMQAVLLDILLIIPGVLLDNVLHPPGSAAGGGGGMGMGMGPSLYVTVANTIFLFVAVCVAYGVGACAVGQTPRLPLVAEAADTQVGRDGPPSGF